MEAHCVALCHADVRYYISSTYTTSVSLNSEMTNITKNGILTRMKDKLCSPIVGI